jgi:myo-inositol-1(or 4)-monophosphatase
LAVRPQIADFLALAHDLADRTGAVILPHFRGNTEIDHKGGSAFDPVTAADLAAERAVRELLAERYPTHGVVGEELGSLQPGAEFCWIVDPIDGTRAFIIGQPLWGTLIGLLHEGTPLLGLMDQPFTRERFWGADGGAFYRGGQEPDRPLLARACGSLADAMLASTSPDLFADGTERERFEAIGRKVRLRRFGGDCYNYCLLALGQLDLVVEAGLKAFDIAPLIPIIEGAGGVVTSWDGRNASEGGRIVAAGDRRLHEQAVALLSG